MEQSSDAVRTVRGAGLVSSATTTEAGNSPASSADSWAGLAGVPFVLPGSGAKLETVCMIFVTS